MQLRKAQDQAEIQNCGTHRHDISKVPVIVPETLPEQREKSKKTNSHKTLKMN